MELLLMFGLGALFGHLTLRGMARDLGEKHARGESENGQ